MFIRKWRMQGITKEDGEATGWNRVTFEISTGFIILLMFVGVFIAALIWEAVMY